MTERWDVVVVGAGPAGTAAALGALSEDPSSRVLLLDRADFPRDKPCGDGIAPHVLDVLASVGVQDLLTGWTPVRRLRLSRGDARVEGDMRRAAYVVPRSDFDARLVERAVAAGAVLRRHRVRDVVVRPDGVEVDGLFLASVLVAADGAHSDVRTAIGARRVGRNALALRGYAPTLPEHQGRQVIVFGTGRQPSYAWAFDRGDGLSNVGYGELVRHGRPLSRSRLLERLEALLPGSSADGEAWRGHQLPLSSWRWPQPDGRTLLVGDAAGLVNPMSGEGIYYAVATGVAAGRAARSGEAATAGQRHRRAVRAVLSRHLRHTTVGSRLIAVPAVVEGAIRTAANDRRVFDDLVEIGLGRGTITPRLAHGLVAGLSPLGAKG
jgi:geranylgeranyl reductase family protein